MTKCFHVIFTQTIPKRPVNKTFDTKKNIQKAVKKGILIPQLLQK